MRNIRVYTNDWYDLDIDEKTAIGIDIQSFDIKEPQYRKLNVSNEFSIPKTIKNCSIFGIVGDSQKVIYDDFYNNFSDAGMYFKVKIEYYLNHQLITSGFVNITLVNDRINMFIRPNMTVFDLLKDISWEQFEDFYLQYLKEVYSEPVGKENVQDYSTISEFIERYSHEGVSKLRFLPQFTDVDVLDYNDVEANYYPNFKYENLGNPLYNYLIDDDYNVFFGAKFGTRFVDILKFLEWYFLQKETNVSFIYRNSEKILNLGIPLKHTYVNIYDYYDGENYIKKCYLSSSHFLEDQITDDYFSKQMKFLKTDSSDYYSGVTMLDYLKSVCQILGMCINDISESNYFKLEFTDILNESNNYKSINDNNYTGQYTFKPIVEGYKYLNFIGCEGFNDSPFRIEKNNVWIENMRGNYWVWNAFMSLNENLEKGYNEKYVQDEAKENPFDYDSLNHIFKVNSWQPITYENWTLDREKSKSLAFWHENANSSFNHFLFGQHLLFDSTYKYVNYSTSKITVMFATSIYSNSGPGISQEYCDIECSMITGFNHYSSDTFYNYAIKPIKRMVKIPQTYTVKKYINSIELGNDFRINKPIYIKHLNGLFFINKISGYNPESTQPVEIELIKLTNV